MKIPATIMAAVAAAIALYSDEAQTRPTASGVDPSLNNQFPSSPKFSFTAGALVGGTDFCMTLTVISLQAGQSSMKTPIAATDGMAMEGFKINMSEKAVEI